MGDEGWRPEPPPILAPPASAGDPRVVGLRRMRLLATLLLVAMTVLFVATSFAALERPWLGYVRAFAEAGMIGACADWFAVVALFRHPLGIPIPHTAIVPHNKDRIAAAMGRFVTNNFLTSKVLSQRLAEVEAAPVVANWLAVPANARRIARVATLAIVEIVRALPRERVAEIVGEAARGGIEAMPTAPIAANLLAIVWAHGQTQKLIEVALERLEASLLDKQTVIRDKVEASSSRWIPRWVDSIVAGKVLSAVTTTLTDMRDPKHVWRIELKQAIEALIERLSTDPELQKEVEAAKNEIVASPLFREQMQALWSEIESRLPSDVSDYAQRIESVVASALESSGRWLQEDPDLMERLDRWLRHLIKRIVAPRRVEIGAFVTHVVENWDATTLVNRMELQVGRDLQYIRINGTLVGGLVGVIIYTAARWLMPG